jgi:hypothetical protein
MELGTMHQVFFQRGTVRNRNWDSGYTCLADAEARVNELESMFLQLNSSDAKVWIESTEKDQGV